MSEQPSAFNRAANWDQVSEAVSRTIEASLPLPATLRALAADLTDRKAASLLKRIAARIERGESVESVFSRLGSGRSRVAYLLRAASLTSQPAEMLNRFIGLTEDYIQGLRNIRTALAYPLLCLTVAIFGAVVFTVGWLLPGTQDFISMNREFEVNSTIDGRLRLMLAGNLVSILVGLVVWGVGLLIALGPVRLSRWSLTYRLPILGRYYSYLNLVMFARLMEQLTQSGASMSKALGTVAMLIFWPRLRRAVNDAAAKTAESSAFEDVVQNDRRFPATLRTFLTHPGNKLVISSRFAAAADYYENQARSLWNALPLVLIGFVVWGLLLVWVSYAVPVMMWISWIRVLSGLTF